MSELESESMFMTSSPVGKMTEEEEQQQQPIFFQDSNLLKLPDLVILEILDHLDSASLRAMRRVCHKTRDLIQRPRYFKKMKIFIRSSAQFDPMIRSGIPVCNVAIPICPQLDFVALVAFLRNPAVTLTSLELGLMNDEPDEELEAANRNNPLHPQFFSPALKMATILYNVQSPSLTIAGALSSWFLINFEVIYNQNHFKNLFKQNLVGLRSLKMGALIAHERDQQHKFFSMFLTVCPNLVEMEIPHLHLDFETGANDELCDPLISYLRPALAAKEPGAKLTIDFGHVFLNGEGKNMSIFPLTTTTLYCISKLRADVRRGRLELLHVPIVALPALDDEGVSDQERRNLDHCVSSVLVVPFAQNKYMPTGCKKVRSRFHVHPIPVDQPAQV